MCPLGRLGYSQGRFKLCRERSSRTQIPRCLVTDPCWLYNIRKLYLFNLFFMYVLFNDAFTDSDVILYTVERNGCYSKINSKIYKSSSVILGTAMVFDWRTWGTPQKTNQFCRCRNQDLNLEPPNTEQKFKPPHLLLLLMSVQLFMHAPLFYNKISLMYGGVCRCAGGRTMCWKTLYDD